MLVAKFSEAECDLIQALPRALTIRDLARKTGRSVATTWRIYKKLYGKGKFVYVFDHRRFGLSYLAVISAYTNTDENEWPQGTLSVRRLWGLGHYVLYSAIVPYKFIDRYVKSLNADVVVVVRGLEFHKWRPDSGGSMLVPGAGLVPFLSGDFLDAFFKEKRRSPPSPPSEDKVPDPIDMAILVKKLQAGPFARPIEGVRYALSVDPSFPKVSEKTVGYHYKEHVLPAWLYNTFIPFFSIAEVPLRVFYFEGKEAPMLARILIRLPYFFTALVDIDRSLLTGQPPPWMLETIYRVISSFNVKAPLCQLVMSHESIAMFIPHLWKFLKRSRKGWNWTWPEEKVRIALKRKKKGK